MRAWRVTEWCEPGEMTLTEVERPDPGEGEALVRVRWAALNFFDTLMIGGRYQVKPPLPFTPGCEMAGEVVAVGPGSDFRPGDRVCGQPGWGAFGEYCTIGNASANRVPDDVPLDVAACVPVVYPTAHVALGRRGGVKPGEFVLVSAGAGGVGLAAIQIAKAWGGRPIALAGSEEKRRICIESGAELALDYRDDSWVEAVREHTGGHGVDVVFDPVGGETFNLALKVIAFEGRAVIIGFAGGSIQQVAANRLLLKSASAVGAIWGAYLSRDPDFAHGVVADCFELWRAGKIRPIIWETYPLDRVPEALDALGSRRTWGKVLIAVAPEGA